MYLLPLLSGVLAVTTQVSARSVPQIFARHTEGDCSPQPLGAGPVPSSDTPQAFLSDPDFDNAANQASTPAGYSLVYQDQKAASVSNNYLGYDNLPNYDPSFCSESCANNWAGCVAFNIYFERDPTVDPGVNCTNPPSTTNIKCSYFGSPLSANSTTNSGQVCANFQIVIAGSNGYNMVPPAQCMAGTRTVNGRTCTVSCGIDRPGGDYGNAMEPNFEACIQACAADSKCVTAQYHEDTGYCYFKSVLNSAVSAPGEDTVDCTSNTTTSTTTTTTVAPITTTTTTAAPTTTMTTTTTTSAASTTSTSPAQCTAGTRSIGGRTCTTSCGTDRPGGDYGNKQEPSFEACIQACAADSNCVTAQFHEDTMYCYFKNVKNSAVSATGIDTVDCGSSSSSTTTTIATTTTTVVSTTKASSTTATTTTATTTKAVTTTTTTTTSKTTTKTTTTSTAQATPTDSPCFRLYGTCPGFIAGDQLSLDQYARLSHTADNYDTVFTLDKYGALRSASNKGALVYRSTECKKHATYGYVTTKSAGGWWIICQKAKLAANGKGNVSCQLYGQQKNQDFYTTSTDGEVVMGTSMPVGADGKPMNGKNDWQTFGLVYQPALCPNGGAWLNW